MSMRRPRDSKISIEGAAAGSVVGMPWAWDFKPCGFSIVHVARVWYHELNPGRYYIR